MSSANDAFGSVPIGFSSCISQEKGVCCLKKASKSTVLFPRQRRPRQTKLTNILTSFWKQHRLATSLNSGFWFSACHNSFHWLKSDLHFLAVLLSSVLACSTILTLTQCVYPQKFSLAWAMIKRGAKKLSHHIHPFISSMCDNQSDDSNLPLICTMVCLCYEPEATASLTQTKWLSIMNQSKDVSWHHPFYFDHVIWVGVIFMSNKKANLSSEPFSHVVCFESQELRPQLLKWVRDVSFLVFWNCFLSL